VRTPLTLACLALSLAPVSAAARTIEAEWSLSYETASLVTSVDSSSFYFESMGDLVLSQPGLGIGVFAAAFPRDDFARAMASLTDGPPAR